MRYFLRLSVLFGILISMFQNCTHGEGDRPQDYVVKTPSQPTLIVDDGGTDSSASNGTRVVTGQASVASGSTGSIDSISCFSDYFSVFSWENSGANLMSEKPVLGIKLGTVPLGTRGFLNSPIYSGWSAEGIIQTNSDGSTVNSIRFLKGNPSSSNALLCYLMRASDEATLNAGLANTVFKDIGADPNLNTFVGFLRYQEQFIGCRVALGHGETIFSGDSDILLNSKTDQAFLIKRGCYQTYKVTN